MRIYAYLIKINGHPTQGDISYCNIKREYNTKVKDRAAIAPFDGLWLLSS